MRLPLLALALATFAAPAIADETSGTIIAYDRVDRIIVLDDKTIWTFGEKTELSPDLSAGDAVKIIYTGAADSGIGPIASILRVNE
ncbi:hypothetical protein DEA8626_03424 [Defluviimonas aquaemixtae]|uniref:DUF5666 domain-containing protein n=1 Tax=Albidovulum aquaemixtae TaxID=1542388 RepID=A0A2R8BLZ7_9RHOB|nr:hypothetical protein [Defluviimonas aquaemixtae]SPH24373.1 hypothetical protein DEA8626_03424 [Defluviimonas aquaemixtae]